MATDVLGSAMVRKWANLFHVHATSVQFGKSMYSLTNSIIWNKGSEIDIKIAEYKIESVIKKVGQKTMLCL